jgi:hypothetical protein
VVGRVSERCCLALHVQYLICSIKSRQWNTLGSYILLNGVDCYTSGEREWMKKEGLCV